MGGGVFFVEWFSYLIGGMEGLRCLIHTSGFLQAVMVLEYSSLSATLSRTFHFRKSTNCFQSLLGAAKWFGIKKKQTWNQNLSANWQLSQISFVCKSMIGFSIEKACITFKKDS